MHPNQQYPGQGGASNAPYPQQPPHNVAGAQRPQQPPFGNPASYSIGSGIMGGNQPSMPGPHGGNQGGYGSSGNPYGQSSGNPYGQTSGNPYAQGSNPPGGNPYAQSSYGMSGGGSGPGSYPSSGQQPYGNNPYAQNSSTVGAGYPPSQSGGYPPQSGAYQPQSGGYQPRPGGNPPPSGGYPPQSGGNPPPSGGYPPQSGGNPPPSGGYPPQSGGNPPPSGGYPPQSGGYPPQSGGYPPQSGGYPPQSGGYPGQQSSYPSQGGFPGSQQSGGFMSNDQRSQQLNQLVQRYEISPQIAARLHILANCEIVVLCDDSGSMNTPLQGTNQTRWDELKSLVNIVVDICAVMDSNGVDVYFLNRDPVLNVTNAQNMRHVFNSPAKGLTPLVPALRKILAAKRSLTFEKKLLILIATDGAPTNERGQTDIGSLEAVLRNERTPQTYITFLACTDDLDSVNYLSSWDKSMPNLDVIDDYRSERAEIQRIRGANFPFSFGDYIVKALLGSIDPWFDSLDERA
ncbi:unnamed protein product [Rotaria sp. Silwood2]|nr:unnamed protein product [Rotaria sp. Silwood2]CAF4423677.1 unnamed protein product [Rotaria sp. Silwood2]